MGNSSSSSSSSSSSGGGTIRGIGGIGVGDGTGATFSSSSASDRGGFLRKAPPADAPPVDAALRLLNIFPEHEYGERMKNLRHIMYEEGYDILWLTDPSTIAALTGFERTKSTSVERANMLNPSSSGSFRTSCLPAAVAVHVGSSSTLPPVAFDQPANMQRWLETSTCSEQVGSWVFDEDDSLNSDNLSRAIASVMHELLQKRWLDAAISKKTKLGMEFSAPWKPSVFSAFKAAFESEGNCYVCNCSDDVVPSLEAQMRSRREIECLRCAANVLAVGIDSIRRRLDVNRTELDLYGTHVHHMVISGGEIPWKYPGTIKVNPLQSYEIPGRTEVRPGDMVFVSTSGVFEGQYASACRAFYLQPFPSPVDMAPLELHEAFKMAGSLFTAFETSTPFPRDTADSRLLVSDLCVMIGKHFDSLGCYADRADQRGSGRSASRKAETTESRARGDNFTRSCELLLGSNGCITIDVDDFIEQHTSATSKKRAPDHQKKYKGASSKRNRPLLSALTVLHAGAVLRIKAVVYCTLNHSRIRVAATMSETVIARSDCIEPLGPTPRRLVEVSPLSWLWT